MPKKGLSKKRIKQRGTNFEYRVRDYFRDHGWKVFRSAGSQSCADLIAFKTVIDRNDPDETGSGTLWSVAIQCKASDALGLSTKETQELIELYNMGLEVVVIGRHPTSNALLFFDVTVQKFMEEPWWIRF